MKKSRFCKVSLIEHQTQIVKEGNFLIRELRYYSTDDELLLRIHDAKNGAVNKILNLFRLFANVHLFSQECFVAVSPDEQQLFTIKRNRGLDDSFSIYSSDGELIGEIKGATKLKYQLGVSINGTHVGDVTGGSNWWTCDSEDGNRYLDYKKHSLQFDKNRAAFKSMDIVSIPEMPSGIHFVYVLLSIPYTIEVIFLHQNT